MGSLKKFYKVSPFWDGVSSAFDLLGLSNQFDVKARNQKRKSRNCLKHDLETVGKYMREALKDYEEEIKHLG
jgi:hypothetical protein